jgi:kynurenine formamidase
MEITATIGGRRYAVDIKHAHDISIAVRFDDSQLSVFGAPPAYREAYKAGGFVGDVRQGGSCNCDMLHFSPHLHGTHTECVGHIASAAISVHEILKDSLIAATLISVAPQPGKSGSDSYMPKLRATDTVITKDQLVQALLGCDHDFLEALVVRTLPNDNAKIEKNYGDASPPFFSLEAMQHLVELGVKHLLVDVPSIDRLDDEGRLSNHHLFWGVAPGSHTVDEKNPSLKTVTEFIYVPDGIENGTYMLNLQVAAFAADAAPSRPLLYKVTQL